LRTLRKAFSIGEAFEGIGLALPETGDTRDPGAKGASAPQLCRLAGLDTATDNALSFLSDRRYLKQANSSQAAVILVSSTLKVQIKNSPALLIAVENPYAVFARLSQWVATKLDAERESEIGSVGFLAINSFPGTFIHPTAHIGANVRLAPGVVVGAGTQIEEDAVIEAHCVIGRDCRIGRKSRLYPHVVVYDDCQLGSGSTIHSGTVIGADGFGFAKGERSWIKIAQLGAVRIGDDVEIGSNCSIDRGTIDDTIIEDGCKLDNLIQIAHNVRIGAQSVLAACVGVAGSARIGERCMIGGSVGILGHLSIADDVTVTPMSLVMSTISQSGVYSGSSPLQAHRDWEKSAAIQRGLPDLRSRLRALEALNKNKPETL
jgi:UDP-3-O-[3-hydroxymyristoyl] glucosamine N-acyltransferase